MDAGNPLAFIDVLRGTDEYLQHIYSHGGCYKFVVLMQYVYGRGEAGMTADGSHCGVRIDGQLYVMYGLQTDTKGWHKFTKQDYERAQQWSFHKHHVLILTHCPHCDEPITFPNIEYKVDKRGMVL